MRAMPFEIQGQGVLEVVQAALNSSPVAAAAVEQAGGFSWSSNKRKRGVVSTEGLEPRSVLDHRRSPSPPTSSSTLSSSLGGGGAASDSTAGVAAVSDSTNRSSARKWPPSSTDSTPSSAPTQQPASAVSGVDIPKKEEWAAVDLQPIPPGLEMNLPGLDWESMLGDTATLAASSPGREQSFLHWIMGDIDEQNNLNLKQQQFLHQGEVGFGFAGDQGFGLEAISGAAAVNSPLSSSVSSASGFPLLCSTNSYSASRTMPPAVIQQQQQFASIKVPNFGNQLAENPTFGGNNLQLQPAMFFEDSRVEEKPQLSSPSGGGVLLNQQPFPNQSFFLPISTFAAAQPEHGVVLPPPPKRHHALSLGSVVDTSPKLSSFSDLSGGGTGHELLRRAQQPLLIPQLPNVPYHLQHRPMKPKSGVGNEAAAVAAVAAQKQQQALVDQLFNAAELIEAGNSFGARGILARLNHQLPSPVGKPFYRSAFYFKEALLLLLNSSSSANTSPQRPSFTAVSSALDIVLKLSAYKAFSEVSPIVQFTNFTSVQALLEELGTADRIHIVDFDIGVGGQWSSLMQEIAQRRTASASAFCLKITAFVSPSALHPIELHLTRENLSHFAADLNIPFEFNALPLDSFDPATILAMSGGVDESIAVNLPVGSAFVPSFPEILHLVKQLSPKLVVSVDQGCDRSDLQLSHHFLHALQSSIVLLDSIDAVGTVQDVTSKIERFLLQPRIENSVMGRHRAGNKVLPWRSLFASVGFVPVQFSNFTETQAECLLKRVQVRGFHVEKRQSSLYLYWQRGELASVSAWRC